jgi:hypothetical protein
MIEKTMICPMVSWHGRGVLEESGSKDLSRPVAFLTQAYAIFDTLPGSFAGK